MTVMDEKQYEQLKAVAKAVATAWAYIKEALMNLIEQVKAAGIAIIDEIYIDHKAAKRKARSLRQSWIVKQDTRRLSQVINNKPAHMPRILY
jgi:hypothetical protein